MTAVLPALLFWLFANTKMLQSFFRIFMHSDKLMESCPSKLELKIRVCTSAPSQVPLLSAKYSTSFHSALAKRNATIWLKITHMDVTSYVSEQIFTRLFDHTLFFKFVCTTSTNQMREERNFYLCLLNSTQRLFKPRPLLQKKHPVPFFKGVDKQTRAIFR